MLCQRCKKHEADITVEMSINGREQHLHLCQDCARQLERQYMSYFRSIWMPLSGLFMPEDEPVSVGPGARTHAITGTVDQEISRRREINALEAQLSRAVSSERYEEAAQLRDQIRAKKEGSDSHEQ